MSYHNRRARRQARQLLRNVLRIFGTHQVRLSTGEGECARPQTKILLRQLLQGVDGHAPGTDGEARRLQAASRLQ